MPFPVWWSPYPEHRGVVRPLIQLIYLFSYVLPLATLELYKCYNLLPFYLFS